jgi:hypothetical protein
METIKINDVEYVRKDSIVSNAINIDGLKAVIVRTYSAGVFYGFLESQVGQEVVLKNARRMWQWFGASLSECAQSGTPDASKCKFPEAVTTIKLLNAIEILDLTPKALASLDAVKIWKV